MNLLTKRNIVRKSQRRRGVAMVYVALTLTLIIGISAFSIDMSWLYARKATAQKAADAAALAGAWQLANFHAADADGQAIYYASLPDNGGYSTAKGDTVTIVYPATDEANNVRPNWYRVTVSRPEKTFFAGIFGSKFKTVPVRATATALYETLADLNINGGGTYGKAPGPVNLSLFGPDGNYNNGDCYSVKKLPDGKPNPLYTGNGYDFTIKLDATMRAKSAAYVQIFDPDCYNASGANADGVRAIDEYRGSGEGTTSYLDATTTKYSLYYDNNTPYNIYDDVLLKEQSYGNLSSTDLIWNDFYSGNPRDLGPGNLRLNVLSTAGGSENGFDLRVNDKPALSRTIQRAGGTAADNFTANNGSSITAQGHMPMNFNTNGTVTITLGNIPVQAANGQLQIRKFDTDVGAKSIVYKCSSLPNMSWNGTLASNGTFSTDTIQVPSNYTTEGTWTATYAAGLGDTSVWDMSYSNYGPGKPGGIRLVR
jgi:Flp pilus assembly protein TadG